MATRLELLSEFESALITDGGLIMPVDQVLAANGASFDAHGDNKSAITKSLKDSDTGIVIYQRHIVYYGWKGKEGNEQFVVYDPALTSEEAYWLNNVMPKILQPAPDTAYRNRVQSIVDNYIANETAGVQDAIIEGVNETHKVARVRVWRLVNSLIEEILVALRDVDGTIQVRGL